jgi:hypothetical protein
MHFNISVYPLTGFLVGINYSDGTYDDGTLEHEIEICLGIFVVDIVW